MRSGTQSIAAEYCQTGSLTSAESFNDPHMLSSSCAQKTSCLRQCSIAILSSSIVFEPEAADMIMRKLEKKQGQHSQLFLCNANPAQKLGIYRWWPSLGSAMHMLCSPAGSSVLLVAVQLQVSVSTTLRPVRCGDRVQCLGTYTLSDCRCKQQFKVPESFLEIPYGLSSSYMLKLDLTQSFAIPVCDAHANSSVFISAWADHEVQKSACLQVLASLSNGTKLIGGRVVKLMIAQLVLR